MKTTTTMPVGWIKLSRSIMMMDEYFSEKFSTVQCWIDLLLMANYADGRETIKGGRSISLRRGQLSCSIRYLATRWGLSVNTVRSRLKALQNRQRISVDTFAGISLITILNYDRYQAYETPAADSCADFDTVDQTIDAIDAIDAIDTPIDTSTDTSTDTIDKSYTLEKQIDAQIYAEMDSWFGTQNNTPIDTPVDTWIDTRIDTNKKNNNIKKIII